jgi:hypothetical protein
VRCAHATTVVLVAALTARCAPRYGYLVRTQEIARHEVTLGSEVTLRTSSGRVRTLTVDELRATSGAPRALVYSTYRTRTPIWTAIPFALAGTVFGSLLGLTRCFEGCSEPGVAIVAGGALFTVVGAGLGWGLGSMIGLAQTTPVEAEVAVPEFDASASVR